MSVSAVRVVRQRLNDKFDAYMAEHNLGADLIAVVAFQRAAENAWVPLPWEWATVGDHSVLVEVPVDSEEIPDRVLIIS